MDTRIVWTVATNRNVRPARQTLSSKIYYVFRPFPFSPRILSTTGQHVLFNELIRFTRFFFIMLQSTACFIQFIHTNTHTHMPFIKMLDAITAIVFSLRNVAIKFTIALTSLMKFIAVSHHHHHHSSAKMVEGWFLVYQYSQLLDKPRIVWFYRNLNLTRTIRIQNSEEKIH